MDIADDELEIDFDPTRPRLENATKAGHPFSIGWSREVRCILAGLDSTRLMNPGGPWVIESPFDTSQTRLCAIIPDSLGDGGLSSSGHYRDGMSTASTSGTDHLSASLGITVGYPFLNASVTGKYDKRVTENRNGIKASRNASCRVGRVIVDETPPLSEEAITLLQMKDGQERFRKRYGDFYISGFALGADAGACMSAATSSKATSKTVAVTVKVKALFWSKSSTYSKTTQTASMEASISLSGYSTLDLEPMQMQTGPHTSAQEMLTLNKVADGYMTRVRELQPTVTYLMEEIGIKNGARLALGDCVKLCESGLVAELLLEPYARLSDYVTYA